MTKKRKNATIRDVAKMAGVSTATVSRCFNHKGVVNKETYEKIMEAILELDYQMPPAFTEQKTDSAGKTTSVPKNYNKEVILISIPAISNPFYSDIIKGIQSSATNNDYEFLLYSSEITEHNLEDFLCFADSINVHGFITLTYMSEPLLEAISRHFPIVQCCEFIDSRFASSVGIDDYASVQQAMDYFLSMGRKKIALINGPLTFRYSQNRLDAYINNMKSNHLDYPDNWVIQLPDLNPDMAFSSVVKLLSAPDAPDCFFAVSDILAAAAIRAAQYCNYKVPNNILVIGFDNTVISQLTTPSITTISQPKFQLGYLAAELLYEKISNPLSEIKHMKLSTELIIRESTTSSL